MTSTETLLLATLLATGKTNVVANEATVVQEFSVNNAVSSLTAN